MPSATDVPRAKSPAPPRYAPNKDDEEDLRAINAALDRMHKVTPPDPYVLTIPQDVEPRYHHHRHPAWTDQWLRGTPFDKSEHESLQYQTFIYHEHGKEMYVLHNSRPLDNSASNGAGANRPRSRTGANTPNNAGPKKKISLDAYKKKLTGTSATATPDKSATKAADAASKQGAVKGPVERVKAETEEMLAAVAESEAETPSAKQEKQESTERKELKRKREEDVLPTKAEAEKSEEKPISDAAGRGAQPTAKKVKTESKPTTSGKDASSQQAAKAQQSSQKSIGRQQPDEDRAALGMPPRLSPGMPEKLSPPHFEDEAKLLKRTDTQDVADVGLPRRLSATIPENLLKTLNARAHARSGSDLSAPNSASKTKDGKLTPLARPNGIAKKKSPIPRNGFRASSSPAVRSDVEEKPIPKSSAVQRPNYPELSQDEEIAVGKAVAAKSTGQEALLVKLKFKKSVRGRVQNILKMRSQPAKSTPQPPSQSATEPKKVADKSKEQRHGEKTVAAPSKGVATKVASVKKEKKAQVKEEEKQPIATKRPMPDEEKADGPTKRVKTEEQRKEPSTPASREVDSPMAQKSALPPTPGTRKDLLSAATMQRQQSQDSVTAYNTPPAQSNTPSVTNSASQPNGITRLPSSQPSSKTPKQQVWETEQKRLEGLGRELKHAASADLSAKSNDPKVEKLAAIKSLESLLCYLLAFTCADEAALAADPKQAPASRPWRSLSAFFGFVKRATDPFSPLNGLVQHLGVVFSAHVIDIATRYPSDSRESLTEIQALMLKAAGDAEARLDLDRLQEKFPLSWDKRNKKLPPAEKLEPGKLAGPYKLPLGIAASPLQAARAGHAMLQEWTEKDKLDYSLKLKL